VRVDAQDDLFVLLVVLGDGVVGCAGHGVSSADGGGNADRARRSGL
jgi:hypothetical protein